MNGSSLSDPSLVRDELLHELFEASVDRDAQRIAVVCGDTRLSYGELEARANRIARALRERGVGREDRVAVLLPRGEAVYAAILGVLKAGAAYVPLDPETPADRALFILKDCGAKCLVSLSGLCAGLPAGVALLRLDSDAALIGSNSPARLPRGETGASPESLCYVIYTSGTTGQPKGVMIEHRSAAHLVRAEARLYGLRSSDRIFQFFSVAFDASVEEIWMAFFHGAALVAGTRELVRPGPEFSRALASARVTVFSCVPTFLAMLEEEIPTLRILILGGEACPADIAQRWCRPGRTVFNTYGPTEATVVATAAVLNPATPVTIGGPIANYGVFLLDERLAPVPEGAEGEICIGGPGLARGYLNRPDLQREKFIVTDKLTGQPLRLYRTGDLARWTPRGELEYLGRSDGQIKLRGYRIELSGIEAALMQVPDVQAAAAALRPQTQQLAAYVVLRCGSRLDRSAVRAALAARLPPYMLPASLDELQSLPMTSSGKIDRERLPAPAAPLGPQSGPYLPPRDDAERAVAEVWQDVLKRERISISDDFFLQLDGHSMLAAVAVSRLRSRPGFETISIADLYAHPTVEALARLAKPPAPQARAPFRTASETAFRACAAAQALGVLFLSGLTAWQWLGEFLVYGYLVLLEWPIRRAMAAALVAYLVTTPALLLLSIAVKWVFLGRMRPGRHPLWGWYYWRFWFVRAVVRAVPVRYLAGSPLLNLYYRLMGARIGRDVYIGALRAGGLSTFDLLEVGDGSSIGAETSLDGSSVEGGMLALAPVSIGRRCWIGNRCCVGGDVVLEDGAGLEDLSMLPEGSRVAAGELWRGSPAARAGTLEQEEARSPWDAAAWLAHLAGLFVFPLAILAAVFPGIMLVIHLGHASEGYSFLWVAPLISLSFIVSLCLETWAFKWVLVGRVREGRYPVGGSFCVRKWFLDQMMAMSLEVTETLYTTLYLRPWLKALGAGIGPRSEIDEIHFEPDLFSAEEECFLGGGVLIGAPRVRSGWVSYRRVRAGRRVFGGTAAVLPGGTRLGADVIIGTLSIPPRDSGAQVPGDTAWFGSPPIRLPSRPSARYPEAQTYRPPPRLVALRLFIEFFRVILPSTLFVVLVSLIVNATDILQDYIGLRSWLLALPFLYMAAGLLAVLATVLLKVLLIGRYQAGERPLWCGYVWRSELVAGVYSNLCSPFFVHLLMGTPFLAWPLRALGAKIGRRSYIDVSWFTDFDLLELGDDVAVNDDAALVTNLFEGRVMKMGRIRIGDRCTVGSGALLQYDTRMGEDSSLGDMSLLMTGETLPPGTRWHGIPAVRKDGGR